MSKVENERGAILDSLKKPKNATRNTALKMGPMYNVSQQWTILRRVSTEIIFLVDKQTGLFNLIDPR